MPEATQTATTLEDPQKRHRKTRRPTPSMRRAIRMKCQDCMADFVDGRQDCGIRICPLYFWQPYRQSEPDLTWASRKLRRAKEDA